MIGKSVRRREINRIWRNITPWIKQNSVPDLSISPQLIEKKKDPLSPPRISLHLSVCVSTSPNFVLSFGPVETGQAGEFECVARIAEAGEQAPLSVLPEARLEGGVQQPEELL